jgi:hypothetical protein
MTVMHRLVTSESDRYCDRRRDSMLPGTENIDLHNLYFAMVFLGEPLSDSLQDNDPGIRRNKDQVFYGTPKKHRKKDDNVLDTHRTLNSFRNKVH